MMSDERRTRTEQAETGHEDPKLALSSPTSTDDTHVECLKVYQGRLLDHFLTTYGTRPDAPFLTRDGPVTVVHVVV